MAARLGVTRVRSLAVLAQNVRAAMERDHLADTLQALDELLLATADMEQVAKAGRLDEPGDFALVVASSWASSWTWTGEEVLAYAYSGENLHPLCLADRLSSRVETRVAWRAYGPERMLAQAADALLERDLDVLALGSFAFPQPIPTEQILDGQHCDLCGRDLIVSAPDPWQQATERD